jgi:hypothetical protein
VTAHAWTELSDVLNSLRRAWDKGTLLAVAAAPDRWEPLSFPLRGPTSTQLSDNLEAARQWVTGWQAAERRGVRIEWAAVGGRRFGSNSLPRHAWIDQPNIGWRLLGVEAVVQTFIQLVNRAGARAPRLIPWALAHPHQLVGAAAAWDRLVSTVLWIDALPAGSPPLYLRQVDVPGVDTKFIEQHQVVLGALLEAQLDPSRIDIAAPRTNFTGRFGFRSKPEYVRFRHLDPAPRAGFTELSVLPVELARNPPECRRVFVVENEITYLAFPPVHDAIAMWGAGYRVWRLARLPWLADREVVYWGDIDTHGFAILDRVRSWHPHATSMLMDRATLHDHEAHWDHEKSQSREDLTRLTVAEDKLYRDLLDGSFGPGVRLEQERVRFSALERALRLT